MSLSLSHKRVFPTPPHCPQRRDAQARCSPLPPPTLPTLAALLQSVDFRVAPIHAAPSLHPGFLTTSSRRGGCLLGLQPLSGAPISSFQLPPNMCVHLDRPRGTVSHRFTAQLILIGRLLTPNPNTKPNSGTVPPAFRLQVSSAV